MSDPRLFLGSWLEQTTEPHHVVNPIVPISEADFALYQSAIAAADHISRPSDRQLVWHNFRELESIRKHYDIIFGFRRELHGQGVYHRQAAFYLTAAIVNWLTSCRLFLDHHETDYKRRFGPDSSQMRAFKSATSDAYDRSASYRIMYRFRNYVQHCGPPLSTISGGPCEDEPTRFCVRFLTSRDQLLDDFDWGRVREDLEALPAQFDILDMLSSAMNEVGAVTRSAFAIDARELFPLLPTLRSALDQLGEINGNPVLLEVEQDEPGEDLRFSHLPLVAHDRLVILEQAAAADDPLSLLDRERVEAPLPENFSATDEARHRHLRGTQVVAAWLDHDATPAFANIVNALIEEDGDVEPVMTGVINVCTFALALAGAATGSTPRSVLGRFAGEYGVPLPSETDSEGVANL